MPPNHSDLEKRLWDAADELSANSKLKSSEYSVPVLRKRSLDDSALSFKTQRQGEPRVATVGRRRRCGDS